MKNQDELIKIAKSARATDFPFSDSKLASILDKVDSANPTPPSKLKGKTKMSAIGITLIGLIIGALTMNPLVNKDKTDLNNSHYEKAKQEIALNKQSGNISNSNTQIEAKVQAITKGNSEAPKVQDSIEEDLHLPNSAFIDLAPTAKEKHYIPAIVLSKEELRKLYVYFDDDGLFYIDEAIYPPYKFHRDNAEQLLKLNSYPEKGTLKQLTRIMNGNFINMLLPYDGLDINKSLGIFPIAVFAKDKNEIEGGGVGNSNSNIANRSLKFNTYRFINKGNELLEALFNKTSLVEHNSVLYINFPDSLKSSFNNYTLIIVPDLNQKSQKLAIFVYPTTSNLIALLPSRYANLRNSDKIFEHNYLPLDKNKLSNQMDSYLSNIIHYKITADSLSKLKEAPPIIQKSITGITKLLLTKSELKNLNISYESGFVSYPIEERVSKDNYDRKNLDLLKSNNYKVDDDNYLIKGKGIFEFCNAQNNKTEFAKYTGWSNLDYSKTSPIGVWQRTVNRKSETSGSITRTTYSVQTFDQMFQSPIMLDLLNVLYIDNQKLVYGDNWHEGNQAKIARIVRLGGFEENCFNSDANGTPKLELYYYVNREFIELLPERYKTPLSKELDVLEKIESGELPAEEACKAIKGQESYMGVCSITASNIVSVNVYTNPVSRESFSAGVIVRKEANISVDLYNSTGDLVKRLIENIQLQGGNNSIKFENALSGVSSGMYILSFVQENGERVTRNIIIR